MEDFDDIEIRESLHDHIGAYGEHGRDTDTDTNEDEEGADDGKTGEVR